MRANGSNENECMECKNGLNFASLVLYINRSSAGGSLNAVKFDVFPQVLGNGIVLNLISILIV